MNSSTVVNIIIADDHCIFIEGLKTVLKEAGDFDFQVVGEALNGKMLVDMLGEAQADLLFLDMNMPEMDGLEVLDWIKNRQLDLKIIVLTMYDEAKIIRQAFKTGADGYVLKSKPVAELHEAIGEVMAGNTYMGSGVALTNGLVGKADGVGNFKNGYEDRFILKHHLTKRELEILNLISQAMSNKEIAKELFISVQTVSVHRKNIMRKLGVTNTAGLVKVAFDNNLI